VHEAASNREADSSVWTPAYWTTFRIFRNARLHPDAALSIHSAYRDRMAEDTRARLIDGALDAIRRHGIAGTSARTIAAAAGVNQALVFYHFGTVHDLLKAASLAAAEARVAAFGDRLAAVTSLPELLAVGRELHAEERTLGNVQVLAQMLAGAQTDPQLAEATAGALRLWFAPVEQALARLLAGSPLAELLDTAGLARAASAAFIGLELFEGVDPDGAAAALDAVERLAILAEVVDDLGPVARRTLRAKLKRREG
jgi:AcrR family transcriptional regulator